MASTVELDFYHSDRWVTEPGTALAGAGGLPPGIPGPEGFAHGLVVRYRADRPLGPGAGPDRMVEVGTRYARDMFAGVAALDGERPLEQQ